MITRCSTFLKRMLSGGMALCLTATLASTPTPADAGLNDWIDAFKNMGENIDNNTQLIQQGAEYFDSDILQCIAPKHGMSGYSSMATQVLTNLFFSRIEGFCSEDDQEVFSDAWIRTIWANCVDRFGTGTEKTKLMLGNVPRHRNGAIVYYLGGQYMWPYNQSARKDRWRRHRYADDIADHAGFDRFVNYTSAPGIVLSNPELAYMAERCGKNPYHVPGAMKRYLP